MLRLVFALLAVSNCLLADSCSDGGVNGSAGSGSPIIPVPGEKGDAGSSLSRKCGPNEQYVNCTSNRCVPQTCAELEIPVPCPLVPNQCNTGPGCVCVDGYLRNNKGVCVPEKQCPSCNGDPNAEAGCGFQYGRHCSRKYKVPQPCVCHKNGCSCKRWFVYDDNISKCVRPEKCTPVCKKNEVLSSCANGGCRRRKCSDVGILCIDPIECKPGCICKKGYVQNCKGECIPVDQCNIKQCGPNEQYVDCTSNRCVPQNCTELGIPVPCPIVPNQCAAGPGCVCVDGYLRNNKGVCVPDKQCPSCAGDPNAEAGCGFQCGRHCSKDFKVPTPCTCQRNGCSCKKGFVYDDNVEKCVRPQKCTPQCKENEFYASCPDTVCYPKDCSELGFPVPCPIFKKCPSKPACVCRGGYIRNTQGECVSASECPSCGGDVNASVGCGSNCGKRCSDIGRSEPRTCPDSCQLYGCDCKEGYYYDENKNRCVLPKDCPKSDIPDGPCSDAALETLLKGSAEFTGTFMSKSYNEKPTTNLVMSPISVFIPMGELAMKAENNTYTQLMKALNLQTKNDIRCAFPALTRDLRGDSNVILNLAARIFTTDKYPLTRSFRDETKNIFNAEAESINFLNKQAAANQINQWVEDQTNDRIKNLANPDMFDESTRLVLVNAIYFLGNWESQFDGNKTTDRDFHVDNQTTIKIPTMYQQHSFKYGEISSLDCKALEMFYKGGNFSFFVLLPNKIDGLAALIEKLQSPNEFYGAYDNTRYEKVNVYLPKIKTESELDLKTIMSKMGITDIFDSKKSKLNDILEKYEPLYVSTAIQKAFIEVTETGTEAAAANILVAAGGGAGVGNPPPVYDFRANHPFVYFILHNRNILFTGLKWN